MCGIIAYIGARPCRDILIEGLKRLEYRGYDSAGLAITQTIGDCTTHVCKTVGRVADLERKLEADEPTLNGTIGLAHTRWATHGAVTDPNTHPHTDDRGLICLVHNGIIENYVSLKKLLEEKGRKFRTETDTEVLATLVSELYDPDHAKTGGMDLEAAVQAALREVTGAYAIAVMSTRDPDTLVVARKGSPLIVGIGNGEFIVASDGSAIISHTARAMTLDDYSVVRLTRDGLRTSTIDNVELSPKVMQLEIELGEIELGGFEHYMRKEIFEQPRALRRTMSGRLNHNEGCIVLGGLLAHAKELVRSRRVIICGQGTALNAGMVGEYLFEDLARIPTEVEYASELRYRNPIIEEGTVVIAVSQSGETADTLAALHEVRDRGALGLGVINVVGSTISRDTDAGVYLRVGPEIGVASTKAFTGQVMVLTMMSLFLARRRLMSGTDVSAFMAELARVPDHIEAVLEQDDEIRAITEKHIGRENWLFLGRGYNYPTAMEGALKLKEISYIHAEGMPAAEMKHGPIALIDEGMPVVFIATKGAQYDKVMSNIEEVRSRGGHIIAVATEGDEDIRRVAEDVIYIPECPEPLSPMVAVVPLQLIAYHAAVLRGHDVDKPRNLAKSVTVE
ncbi:MAG: glutamine--fructose-6-phosphate transaminase (isomerizing) [Phycisphaeraceae bacterium]|nr:MAG: glutamine--fructose-6-phosphate transaminase (isomerizing) [Phycisphaeraceae bacterium]